MGLFSDLMGMSAPDNSGPGYMDRIAGKGLPQVDYRDFTTSNNTALPPQDEQAFQGWVQSQSALAGRDVSKDLYDYDLRGWWKANGSQPLTGAHLTDDYKKPNHPTFSDQSQYSGADGNSGGQWVQQPGGGWGFAASPSTMFSKPELQQYFRRVEPDNTLIYPTSRSAR